jgi:cell division protein FtsQ
MPVAAPSDRRFRRSQVRPARRRRPWTGHGWQLARTAVAVAVAVYAAYCGALLVLTAETLHVTRITVTGNERLSKGEVVALVEGLRGQSMVTADLESWRRKLMASRWVSTAGIRRVLPGTIAVAIAERQPMGIGRVGAALYLIDEEGTIIDEFGPNYADLDLPIIDGLAGPPSDTGPMIDAARAALAARLLASLQAEPELGKRVSQVDVTDARDAAVVLKNDPALLRLGDDQFVERLRAYIDLAPALKDRVDDIDYVDLRFDDRIYVRPHSQERGSRVEGRTTALRKQGRGPKTRGQGPGSRGGED